MKNNRIVKAYDSINPSAADKQRMLDAILAEANLEETPRQTQKAKEPIVYTAKPTKTNKWSILGALAACFAVLILAGFVLRWMGQQDVMYADPTQSASEPINVTVNFSYTPVLEKYRAALKEGWTKEQCQIEGISTRFYLPEPVDFTIGHRILDINDDGHAELLIGHDNLIWDLYTTLEDGTPVQLLSDEQDGWQYYLCENQLILAEYYSKEDCYVEYYRLEDHRLVMQQQFQYRDGQWMMESAEQEWEMISEKEVQNLTNSIEKLEPEWIPFAEGSNDAAAAEPYLPVLEKYKTAVIEDWNPGICMENGISLMIGYCGELYDELGYATMDLDGNGIDELIITDGNNIYDLYTIIQDETVGPLRLIDATERQQYFMITDGYIYCMGSGSASVSYYTLYSLEGSNLKLLEGYMMDYETNPDDPWFYYDGIEQGEPCPREIAVAAIDPIQFAHISFTSFE